MSLVILIRHGHSSANQSGILSGQTPGVHLSNRGIAQANELSQRLGKIRVKKLLVSPLERCVETITPWLAEFGARIVPHFDENLIEMDYGQWSGKTLRSLSTQRLWKTVQAHPSRVRFPQGESMVGMQERAMRSVHTAISARGTGHILAISHGDVIKAIITSALGLHLDDLQRFVIDPASITIIDFESSKPKILLMNDSSSRVTEILSSPHKSRLLVGGGSGIASRVRR